MKTVFGFAPFRPPSAIGLAAATARPRLVLFGRDELGAEFVQLAVRCFQLLINQPDADGQRTDMVACRLDHPGCDRQRLLFEDAQNLGGLPTAQAVRFDKPLDGGPTQPDRLRRGRRLAPQIEKPIGGEVVRELDHLRVIAPELLTHAAGQTSAFLL
jgi:hypothetical protein